jgi:hypothetical protein
MDKQTNQGIYFCTIRYVFGALSEGLALIPIEFDLSPSYSRPNVCIFMSHFVASYLGGGGAMNSDWITLAKLSPSITILIILSEYLQRGYYVATVFVSDCIHLLLNVNFKSLEITSVRAGLPSSGKEGRIYSVGSETPTPLDGKHLLCWTGDTYFVGSETPIL